MQHGNQSQHSPMMATCWLHTKIDTSFDEDLDYTRKVQMSYPYPYHLLPFETYREWFDADWKSLIQGIRVLQNECIYLESIYATPHQQYDNVLDWLSNDCI